LGVTHPLLIAILSVLGIAIVGYWAWVGGRVVQNSKFGESKRLDGISLTPSREKLQA
jgi:hypothetical protein